MRDLIDKIILIENNIPKNAKITVSPGDVKPEIKQVYKRKPSAKARSIKSKIQPHIPSNDKDEELEQKKNAFLKSINEEVEDLLNQIRQLK